MDLDIESHVADLDWNIAREPERLIYFATCGSGPLLCMAGYSTLWVGYKLFFQAMNTCGSGPLLCMAGYSTLWVGYKLFFQAMNTCGSGPLLRMAGYSSHLYLFFQFYLKSLYLFIELW
jgi:hypothetical protein